MGLQGQLSDVSSDSLPLMLLSLLAEFLSRLRSFLLPPCDSASNLSLDDGFMIALGLANIIVLADQLSLNRLSSYRSAGEDVRLSKLLGLWRRQDQRMDGISCGDRDRGDIGESISLLVFVLVGGR
uniref:Uncharacterized protein n=1 Tax=Brassica oleracea var. oleracea TaxID=109376 RepID=A0A0D3AXI1_BRAOL